MASAKTYGWRRLRINRGLALITRRDACTANSILGESLKHLCCIVTDIYCDNARRTKIKKSLPPIARCQCHFTRAPELHCCSINQAAYFGAHSKPRRNCTVRRCRYSLGASLTRFQDESAEQLQNMAFEPPLFTQIPMLDRSML